MPYFYLKNAMLPYHSAEKTFRLILDSVNRKINVLISFLWLFSTAVLLSALNGPSFSIGIGKQILIGIELMLALVIILLPSFTNKTEEIEYRDFLFYMGWNIPVILSLYWSWSQIKENIHVESFFPPTSVIFSVIGFEMFLAMVSILIVVLVNFIHLMSIDGYYPPSRTQRKMRTYPPSFMLALFFILHVMLNVYSLPFVVVMLVITELRNSLFFIVLFWVFQVVCTLLLTFFTIETRRRLSRAMITINFSSLIESLSRIDVKDPGSWNAFVHSIFNDLDVQTVNDLFNETQHLLPALFYQIAHRSSWEEIISFLETRTYILKNRSVVLKEESLQDFKLDYLLWKISYLFYSLHRDPALLRSLLILSESVPQVNMFQAFLIRMTIKNCRERIPPPIFSQIVERVCELGYPEFLLETVQDRFHHLLTVESRSYLVLNLLFNTSFELVSEKSLTDFSFMEMIRTRQIPDRLFWENIITLANLGADPFFSLLYPLMSSYSDKWTKNEFLWKMYGLGIEEPQLTLLLIGKHVDLSALGDLEFFFEWLIHYHSRVTEDLVYFTVLAWQLQQSFSH